MFDNSTNHLRKPINPSADLYREFPEYLQGPIYQVFERWEEEQSGAVEGPRMVLRPSCGSKVPLTLAFDFALTAVDECFLRELGISA